MPTPMKFIAAHPALDFVNTVGGWSAETPLEDKLENFGDLIHWGKLAQFVEPADVTGPVRLAGRHPRHAVQVLTRARALRGVLHRLFNCYLKNRNPAGTDLKAFEDELRIARRHQMLAGTGRGFLWTWDRHPALDSVLWRVSQSAADLLVSPDLAKVRRCAGENCGWMFLDTTRNHSRQWCDMRDCGNLAKVRRFRKRQAGVRGQRVS
jgi:predicted RNA-binding Zn ribbon-like protein